VSELVAEYDGLLREVRKAMVDRHQETWASTLQAWGEELNPAISTSALREHAKRTARALGGMESIGEIAQTSHDEQLLKLVEALFAKCKAIELRSV
jgi:hypothetical protein